MRHRRSLLVRAPVRLTGTQIQYRPLLLESANAEAVRDLKAKAELESMKKKTVWMKMALAQAYRSGFVYNADANEDQDTAMNTEADSEDPGEQRIADMVVRFKQFKTQMQVCNQCSNCEMISCGYSPL